MVKCRCSPALIAALCGCAAPSIRYSGAVTTGDDPRALETPTRRVALKDQVVVVTHIAWPEHEEKRGLHAVRWNWYEGETRIAERAKTIDSGKTPARFSRSLAASDLGIGHYRVEVLVDGTRVDEQTFDAVAY